MNTLEQADQLGKALETGDLKDLTTSQQMVAISLVMHSGFTIKDAREKVLSMDLNAAI